MSKVSFLVSGFILFQIMTICTDAFEFHSEGVLKFLKFNDCTFLDSNSLYVSLTILQTSLISSVACDQLVASLGKSANNFLNVLGISRNSIVFC